MSMQRLKAKVCYVLTKTKITKKIYKFYNIIILSCNKKLTNKAVLKFSEISSNRQKKKKNL